MGQTEPQFRSTLHNTALSLLRIGIEAERAQPLSQLLRSRLCSFGSFRLLLFLQSFSFGSFGKEISDITMKLFLIFPFHF
jgi:hypothetical protein